MVTLDKKDIHTLSITQNPATGKISITVDLNADGLDKKTLEYLKKLSCLPQKDILKNLGSESLKNIKATLDEQIKSELDNKSSELEDQNI